MALRSVFVALLSGTLLLGCGGDDSGNTGSGGGGGSGGSGGSPDGGSGGDPGGRLFEYASPDAPGPYPTGVMLRHFIDESRPELTTVNETDHRTLPTVVWYPAGEEARAMPKATFADSLWPAVRSALALLAPAGFLESESQSVLEASAAEDGPFPVIVFSHGNSGIGAQSFFLTEYLASHGYIVVCPDHTGNALLTELPGGVTIGPGGEGGIYDAVAGSVADRPLDASFLVDAMAALGENDPDGRFTGKVDVEHVGITGHSFGGLTTLLAMDQDDRFDVGSPMAPATATTTFDRPIMFFVASEDHTLSDFAPVQAAYASIAAPKMYLTVIDAGHFSFSNGCPLGIGAGDGCGTATRLDNSGQFTYLPDTRVHEITRFYQTALWGHYLKGVEAYADDLLATPFAGDVTIERGEMP